MATAAPAAPAQGGETAPSPQPDAGQPTQVPGGAAPASANPIDTTEATGKDGIEVRRSDGARVIKPIPAKKGPAAKLPGVDVMDDGIPGPPRGPDGRFLPASEGKPGEAPPLPGEEPAPEPTTPQRFKFAGEEWDSQEIAEQNFRSLRGQFKPLTQKLQAIEAEHRQATETLHRAAESARGWKAEHDRIAAELEAYRTGKATPQSQPAEDGPSQEVPGVDWDLYAEIHRLATEQGQPWKAEQWLAEQQQRVFEAKLAAKLDEATRPQREAELRNQVGAQTDALFTALADYANADGSPAFPELGDPEAAYQIGKFWTSLGLPPEAALTPQGAIAAIALYRMASGQGSQGSSAAPPAPTPPTPAPPTPNPQVAAAAAAAGLDGGRPSAVVSPSNGTGTMSPEAARILAGLKQATLVRPGLGFEP